MGHFTTAPLGVTTAPKWRDGMAQPISFLPHQVPFPSSEGQMSSQWDRRSGGEEMTLKTAVCVFRYLMCECGCLGV